MESDSERALGGRVDLDWYCDQHGLPFTEYQPVGRAELKHPQTRMPYHTAREFSGEVRDVQVVGDGFLVLKDGVICRGLTCGNHDAMIQQRLAPYTERQEGETVDEAVLCWAWDNFGHFLWQHLARLARVEDKNLPVLVQKSMPDRFRAWIHALGFKNIVSADHWVRVGRLLVPSVVNYRGHYNDMRVFLSKNALDTLRFRLICKKKGAKCGKYIVSRQKARWRRCINEDAIIKATGYEVLEPENMSMEEQLAVFGNAKAIIMPSGGSSPITMFAPPDCTVIELTPPNLVGSFGLIGWATLLGQDYHRIDGVPRGTARQKIDLDYEVDVGQVLQWT